MVTTLIVLYFIITYSLSFLFVYSMGPFNIIDKIRTWLGNKSSFFAELFDCMYCFPTWIGLGLSLINQFLLPQIPFTPFYLLFSKIAPWYVILFLNVFVTNGMVYIMDTVIKKLLVEDE